MSDEISGPYGDPICRPWATYGYEESQVPHPDNPDVPSTGYWFDKASTPYNELNGEHPWESFFHSAAWLYECNHYLNINPLWYKVMYDKSVLVETGGTTVCVGEDPPVDTGPDMGGGYYTAVDDDGGWQVRITTLKWTYVRTEDTNYCTGNPGRREVWTYARTTQFLYWRFYQTQDGNPPYEPPTGWEWTDENILEPIVCNFCELEVSYKISNNGV